MSMQLARANKQIHIINYTHIFSTHKKRRVIMVIPGMLNSSFAVADPRGVFNPPPPPPPTPSLSHSGFFLMIW